MSASPAKASSVDAHLEIEPADQIEFALSKADSTTKVTMKLKHPDSSSSPVAFKVCMFTCLTKNVVLA